MQFRYKRKRPICEPLQKTTPATASATTSLGNTTRLLPVEKRRKDSFAVSMLATIKSEAPSPNNQPITSEIRETPNEPLDFSLPAKRARTNHGRKKLAVANGVVALEKRIIASSHCSSVDQKETVAEDLLQLQTPVPLPVESSLHSLAALSHAQQAIQAASLFHTLHLLPSTAAAALTGGLTGLTSVAAPIMMPTLPWLFPFGRLPAAAPSVSRMMQPALLTSAIPSASTPDDPIAIPRTSIQPPSLDDSSSPSNQLNSSGILSEADDVLLSVADNCNSSNGKKKTITPSGAYKNMTRERRMEANARERTRVHTIGAAFERLRRMIPSLAADQKLSKLSILRITCKYIMLLAAMNEQDYSLDQQGYSVGECVDLLSETIAQESKSVRKN